jgi:hypothetical protein
VVGEVRRVNLESDDCALSGPVEITTRSGKKDDGVIGHRVVDGIDDGAAADAGTDPADAVGLEQTEAFLAPNDLEML